MTALAFVEMAGCITGIIGALLLALNNEASRWGFVFFLASNFCWLAFGLALGIGGMVWMQVAFTVTSLLGIYRWLCPRQDADLLNVREEHW